MLPLKLAANVGDIPGVRPDNILFAAAKLSKLLLPRPKLDIFVDPKPKAMLVNISKPEGYADDNEGVDDFDDDLDEVGKTGMFSGGVSNLCGEPDIPEETFRGGMPAGRLTICCNVLTDGKLGIGVV